MDKERLAEILAKNPKVDRAAVERSSRRPSGSLTWESRSGGIG